MYSLALWGGAARWYVHIGILKYLEEKNIKISEIAWTSMWAIIASLVSAGYNWGEIYQIAKKVKILSLVDFDFKLGLLKWNKIENFLKDIFQDKKIENTQIPLKIVVTDIINNKSEIFTKGLIYEAIRASISLPGVFAPKQIWEKLYVDGGILMNLPIEALEGKDVIAISALKISSWPIIKSKKILGFEFKSGFWQNNYEIIKRSVVDMMWVNEEKSLQTPGKNLKFLRPDFWQLDLMDFHKVDEFVEIGYKQAFKLNLK